MDAVLNSLLAFALLYRYVAIFLIIFLGSLAVPIPSGAILAAAFFFAAEGYLNLWLVAAVGLVANVAGDLVVFWVAKSHGEKLLRRIGLGRLLDSAALGKIKAGITRHPISTIFFSRLTTTVTPLANALAGLAKMPFRTFLVVTVAGQSAEVALNFVYGEFFGGDWTYFSSVSTKLGILTAVAVILVIVVWWRRHMRSTTLTTSSTKNEGSHGSGNDKITRTPYGT